MSSRLSGLTIASALAVAAAACAVDSSPPEADEPVLSSEDAAERRCMPSACPYNCEFTAGASGNRYHNQSPLLKVPASSELRLIWRAREGTELEDGFGTVRGRVVARESPPDFLHCSLEGGKCQADFDCGGKSGAAKKICLAKKAEAKLECCQYQKHFAGKPWVLLNEGVTKSIGGKLHYYAFNVKIETVEYRDRLDNVLTQAGKTLPVSGWVAASDVQLVALHQKQQLEKMPDVAAPPKAHAHYHTKYRMVARDPATYYQPGCKVDGKPCTYHVVRGTRRKKQPGCDGGSFLAQVGADGPKPQDYMGRPGGVVNMLYQTPGVGGASADTFPLNTIFHRAKLPDACGSDHITIPLYKAASSKAEAIAWSKKKQTDGTCGPPRAGKSQTYYYGFVWDGARRRYGWVAVDALEKVAGDEPTTTCGCVAKCKGAAQGQAVLPDNPAFEPYCQSTAETYCASSGGLESSQFVACN